ncbi:glycosyltransferase family 4 protein [Hoeflea sp. CAU 1731]
MQYVPLLANNGVEVEVFPFFDEAYLQAFYNGQPKGFDTIRYYLARAKRLVAKKKADLLWVEKEAFPWLPWFLEHALLPANIPIVADYDDAVFHRYDLHKSAIVRGLLATKIDRLMAASTLVVAGNEYLASRAKTAGARTVEVVPTVVDAAQYSTQKQATDDRRRVGWIGTPDTWANFGMPLFEMLRPTIRSQNATFRAIGADLKPSEETDKEFIPWSEDTEIALIQGMDIGVMPLADTPWAKGKCGYKLIQYMACGLPVIASPIGVNTQIVEHDVNGFLAESDQEWRDALTTLLSDSDLRQRMGKAGREKVEKNYSLQAQGPRMVKLMQEAAGVS